MGISVHTVTGLVLLALTPAAGAQVPIATYPGQSPEVGFGTEIAGAGDVNGDGTPDILVGAPASLGHRGTARVLSGADGATLFTYLNSNPAGKPLDEFGTAVAGCGDLDGDGLAEFGIGQLLVSAQELGGRARIYRGSDGSVLYELVATDNDQLVGASIANAGDIDGDGVDDIAVGAARSDAVTTKSGAVFLLSGATGAVLVTYGGPDLAEPSYYGQAVANAGDVNLDGVPDLLIGAPQYTSAAAFSGYVQVRSGDTGAVLLSKAGSSDHDFFGSAVAGGLDVNASGSPDLLIGAPGDPNPFVISNGYFQVLDGSTHVSLGQVNSVGDTELGIAVAMADVNLDGHADLIVGESYSSVGPAFDAGRARVFSGLDFSVLATINGDASAEHTGRGVAALGDMDGDFASEWAVGTPDEAVTMGHVDVFASTSAWQDVGFALAGTAGAPHATGMGALLPNSPVTLALAGGPPFAAATLVAGVSTLFLPFKGGVLVPSPDVLLPGLPLDNDGDLVLPSTWPTGSPSGFTFWAQFWTPDAGAPKGLSASNGLSGTVP